MAAAISSKYFEALLREDGKVVITGEGENGDPFIVRVSSVAEADDLIKIANWAKTKLGS